MEKESRNYYLLNYVFLFGLVIVFLNDHFLKLEFANGLTGKLSDFAGLLILPMIITFIFPKSTRINCVAAAIFFIFWKSSFSQPFIDFYNQFTPIKIARLIDYSDLIALSMVPISYLILERINKYKKLQIKVQGLHPTFLLVPTAIVLMATSPPHYYHYTFSDGAIQCYNCTKTVPYNQADFLEILSKNAYTVRIDSVFAEDKTRFNPYRNDSTQNVATSYPYYKIDTLIIGTDTITDFQFALEKINEDKTKVYINGLNIPGAIPDDKVDRKLRIYYKKLLKKHIKQSIDNYGF